jgi:4'-phosphopantetheinyl transferase EntD
LSGPPRLEPAPLLAQLGGSVLRSAPVDDALMSDVGIRALIEAGHLHSDEGALALSIPEGRRGTFVAGRLALRQAMRDGGSAAADALANAAFLRTDRGAPHLPDVVTGSVSHKRTLALAVVAPRHQRVPAGGLLQHVGVDLERRPTVNDLHRQSIASRILTPQEMAWVHARATDPLHEREAVLIHFAVKEAIYKAIDPFVHRYVRFTEVELELPFETGDRGEAPVQLLLPELRDTDIAVRAQWHVDGDWIVATAFSSR